MAKVSLQRKEVSTVAVFNTSYAKLSLCNDNQAVEVIGSGIQSHLAPHREVNTLNKVKSELHAVIKPHEANNVNEINDIFADDLVILLYGPLASKFTESFGNLEKVLSALSDLAERLAVTQQRN
jgi:hypothetical protein